MPYLEKNTKDKQNVIIEKMAISDRSGLAILYEDNISGQNNSLLSDYKNVDFVSKSCGLKLNKNKSEVILTTLEYYIEKNN